MAFKWGGGAMSMAAGAVSSRGEKLRGAATKGTQSALDNSALLKERRANKQVKLAKQAQTGTGLGRSIAQSRLGMGWANTPQAMLAINNMREKQESEARKGADWQVRELEGDALLNLAKTGTSAQRYAALTKLVKTQRWDDLEALPPEIQAGAEWKEVKENNFSDRAFNGISAANVASLSKEGANKYKEYLSSLPAGHEALKNAEAQFKVMTQTQVANMHGDVRPILESIHPLGRTESVAAGGRQGGPEMGSGPWGWHDGGNGDDGGTPNNLPT
jgi:hypothetical protein